MSHEKCKFGMENKNLGLIGHMKRRDWKYAGIIEHPFARQL